MRSRRDLVAARGVVSQELPVFPTGPIDIYIYICVYIYNGSPSLFTSLHLDLTQAFCWYHFWDGCGSGVAGMT